MSAIDIDGDEFMAPAAAANAAAAIDSVNKFSRPSTTPTVSKELYAFSAGSKKNFTKQYATLYFSRLTALKPLVLATAKAALSRFPQCRQADGSEPRVCDRILDMAAGEFSVVAGTLYKEMKLKPCILDEYARTANAATAGSSSSAQQQYMSPDDTLVLEDEFGRVPLTLAASAPEALQVSRLVSGMVVSVLGREVTGGKFEVHGLFFPELAPQKPLPPALQSKEPRAPAYMMCVSGLQLGLPGADPLPVQLLMDYVSGLLGSAAEQRASASIVRVLVAGDSLHRAEKRGASAKAAGVSQRGADEAEADEAMAPLRELDLMLTQLAAAVPVDLLPGASDPSNFTLPQQAFHACLFPSASTYSTFSRLTNPAWTQVHGGLQCLATAGQNVSDLAKYCEAPETMDYLEGSLRWRCVAPTAPDTLGCYPYQGKDPFVLEEAPHIYVVGNQKAYASRLVTGQQGQQVRAVCVPSFAQTGTAVLIDLNSPTLEAKPIAFKVDK